MNRKEFRKKLHRVAARHALFFFFALSRVVPFVLVRVFMFISQRVTYFFIKRLRKIARETLTVAFGNEKTEEERKKIVLKCFVSLGYYMTDLLYYSKYPQKVLDACTFEGMEHIEQAMAKGKGAIAVTAHFGNFPLTMLAFAQKGYKVNVIMRRARDEAVGEKVLKIMDGVNVRTIYSHPRKKCVIDSLRALRNNELLFILLDQNFGADGGVFVDFFGRKAATATGPVVFARRAGSSIIPLFTTWEKDRGYRVIIDPECELIPNDDEQIFLEENIGNVTAVIERYIRAYPSEWGWMHRRWKTEISANNQK
ncbi:MAG: lysophospholipid acyltransferase family protein [Candidatus Omnitrophica bacterium]|nr:lysophospholipid acyltransferase family protein [Candidatus Omnitrophota bacterium]